MLTNFTIEGVLAMENAMREPLGDYDPNFTDSLSPLKKLPKETGNEQDYDNDFSGIYNFCL